MAEEGEIEEGDARSEVAIREAGWPRNLGDGRGGITWRKTEALLTAKGGNMGEGVVIVGGQNDLGEATAYLLNNGKQKARYSRTPRKRRGKSYQGGGPAAGKINTHDRALGWSCTDDPLKKEIIPSLEGGREMSFLHSRGGNKLF